ncbi:MAG: hypothetical protein RL654_121 [Pseudomonadota bacterium]|jgi:uncharacterized protein YdaU (DUF1376 family)
MRKFDHHIGDYSAATGHLSWLEDAAYHRLLRHYYLTELPLPVDHVQLYRITRARSKAERLAVDSVMVEFFYVDADGEGGECYRHDRCDAEIVETRRRMADSSEKKANEQDRMRRCRSDRKYLAAELRRRGTHVRWNIGMVELRDLAKSFGIVAPSEGSADETARESSARTDLQRTCNADATANHQPTTNHQHTHNTKGGTATSAGVCVERPSATCNAQPAPSAGQVVGLDGRGSDREMAANAAAEAMTQAGLVDADPAAPKLLAVIDAGASVEQCRSAAAYAVKRGKGAAYALSTLANQIAEAAAMPRAAAERGARPAAPATVAGGVAVAGVDETARYLAEQQRHREAARSGAASRGRELLSQRMQGGQPATA